MRKQIAGVLLAGGRSSRMGTEKPLLALGGKLLIERVADAVAPCVEEVVIVTNAPEAYEFLGLRILADTYPGRGPLAGIHTALDKVACTSALVVACDYPFLQVDALRRIVREDPAGGVVVPEIDGRLHPLCAHYAAEVARTIEEAIATGELRVLSLVARLTSRILRQEALGGAAASRTFFNVNTLDDLRRAEVLLAEAQPRG